MVDSDGARHHIVRKGDRTPQCPQPIALGFVDLKQGKPCRRIAGFSKILHAIDKGVNLRPLAVTRHNRCWPLSPVGEAGFSRIRLFFVLVVVVQWLGGGM